MAGCKHVWKGIHSKSVFQHAVKIWTSNIRVKYLWAETSMCKSYVDPMVFKSLKSCWKLDYMKEFWGECQKKRSIPLLYILHCRSKQGTSIKGLRPLGKCLFFVIVNIWEWLLCQLIILGLMSLASVCVESSLSLFLYFLKNVLTSLEFAAA